MHQAGEAGGCDTERHGGGAAQHLGGGVYGRNISEHAGVKLDVFECLTGTVHGEFAFGGSVGVVEGSCGGAALSDFAQVVDGQRFFQAVSGEV